MGNGMYWSACISTWASRSVERSERGIWMTLVIAASPEIATATSPLLAPARFTARRIASPTASASTIAFSLMALRGVSLDAVLAATHGELDELHRRSRYVKSQERAVLALEEEHFYFLFRHLNLK